ncbi:hypothetical protein H4I96_01773 [Botrytis cinerea]
MIRGPELCSRALRMPLRHEDAAFQDAVANASLADLLTSKNLKSLSTAFGLIKGETSSTAPTAAILVSDQDYSERPNRHIINTTPPPFAAL